MLCCLKYKLFQLHLSGLIYDVQAEKNAGLQIALDKCLHLACISVYVGNTMF